MAEKYGDVKNLNFKQKLEYYWMYYWKLALGIAIVLSVVIAGTVSVLSNEKYDTSFLLVTRGKDLTASNIFVKTLEQEAEKYWVDSDENGEVNILADVISFPKADGENLTSDNETAMQTRLSGELELGDSQLFVMDYTMYEYLVDLGGFLDLTEMFPDRDIPLQYAIPLNETVLYDMEVPIPETGLEKGVTLKKYGEKNVELMDDLVLVMRRDDDLKPENRAKNLQLLQNIVNAGYPTRSKTAE